MSTKIYDDLQGALFVAAQDMTGEKKDRRFKTWAKILTSVDADAKDGWGFDGNFVKDGTVELELGKPQLALVSFRHGSIKYNYGEYAIVKITVDGDIETTPIMASDTDGKGWALRIRDDVIALLDEPDPPTDTSLCPHEHDLMMLGYNQAMLDHATFPITGPHGPLERESIEKIVAQLKAKLNL